MMNAKAGYGYAPVTFDLAAYISQRSANDRAFCDALSALEDEFSTLDKVLCAREDTGMTQGAQANMSRKP